MTVSAGASSCTTAGSLAKYIYDLLVADTANNGFSAPLSAAQITAIKSLVYNIAAGIEADLNAQKLDLGSQASGTPSIVGAGQTTAAFDTAGALGGSILLGDSGGSPNNGGVVIFAANGSAWKFAAIKGLVQNGSNNTQGDVVISTRRVSTDATLTEAFRVDSAGKLTTQVASPAGLVQETWTAMAGGYANSWTDFGGGVMAGGYMKDSQGFVHLRGTIKSGSIAATAFTLPAGYRPSAQINFAVFSNGAFGQLQISSAGAITPQVGSNVSFGLDGISFDTR
jgi:hypothetical protein